MILKGLQCQVEAMVEAGEVLPYLGNVERGNRGTGFRFESWVLPKFPVASQGVE